MKKIFILALVILLANCKKDDTPTPTKNNTTVSSSDYLIYFSGNINGEPFVHGIPINDTKFDYGISTPWGSTIACAYDKVNGGVNYGSGIVPDENVDLPDIRIKFVKFYMCSEMDDYPQFEVFNDKFPVGNYEPATNDDPIYGTPNTIGFSYSVKEGNYTSNGDQSGSSIKITKSTPTDSGTTDFAQFVEGTYTINLYNKNDSSDVIKITDGRFKVRPQL